MSGRTIRLGALGSAAAALVALPLIAQQRPATGPVARYDMRAGTIGGMGAMGRGGGAMMGMMLGGGGNQVQHELYLRLGSSRAPDRGAAKADHFMPAGAKLGKSVALVTPREEKAAVDGFPQDRPKGRLLIFWGCGEHAPRGQPVVIDFARLVAGQIPDGVWTSTILRDWGPTLENSRTFGRWPAEDNKFVKPDSSLLGAHRVVGNYSPEIAFTLGKDFMQPLRVTTTSQASGSTLLRWNAVPDATGYLATLFGGKQGPNGETGDMVMWTSSAARQFGGGLNDWLTPAQVAGLVRDRTVLAPATSTCTVPVEVRNAAPDFRFGMLTAFGPMEEFSYPPRPADARTPWNLEWTARVRHRSFTSWMEAQGMSMGMDGGEQAPAQPQAEPGRCPPRRGGLGGILGGVLRPGC